MNKDRTATDNW